MYHLSHLVPLVSSNPLSAHCVSHSQCVTFIVCHIHSVSHSLCVKSTVCHIHCVSHSLCVTSTVFHIHCVSHSQCVKPTVCHIHCVSHSQCATFTVCHIHCVPHSLCATFTVCHIHCVSDVVRRGWLRWLAHVERKVNKWVRSWMDLEVVLWSARPFMSYEVWLECLGIKRLVWEKRLNGMRVSYS